MKRINLIYLLIIPLVWLLIQLNSYYSSDTVIFYGFAENKETEINLEHPVEVNRILVTPGQKVKMGRLLAEVSHKNLPMRMKDFQLQIQENQLKLAQSRAEIQPKINLLKAQRQNKLDDIDIQIKQLQVAIENNKALVKELKSVQVDEKEQSATNNLSQLKIQALKEEQARLVKPIDLEIAELENRLNTPEHPIKIKIKNLQQQLDFYAEKSEKLTILAPTDGLIGNIHCKEAENVSAFTTLISFYEETPTLVKGFVHESLILEVAVNDTVEVASILHKSKRCQGVVTGLGSRIVEIPDRLRKIIDMKTYGREVLIAIPSDNDFLQKEKVKLSLPISPEKMEAVWYQPESWGQHALRK